MKLLRHLHDLYNGGLALDWHADWPCLLIVAGIVVLSGPLIFLAFAIQDWCAASCWDYEDRWSGTRAFAAAFIVIGLLLVLFRGFLLQFWPHALSVLFWYPVFWWCLCLLLSPALALFAERTDPRTSPIERILLPAEVVQQQQQVVGASDRKATRSRPMRKKQASTQVSEEESASPSPRRRNTRRDPRPIYQAWAVPQIVLPPGPPREATSPSGAASGGSKRDKRDEGESLEDIF